MQKAKNITILLLTIGIIILLLLRKCEGGGRGTIVKIDTVYEKAITDTHYVPVVDTLLVDKIRYRPVVTERLDTLYLPEILPGDTVYILGDYYSKRIYRDTIDLKWKDSLNLGYAYITDTVTENKIAGRYFRSDIDMPVITKTVALPPRNQLYLGGSLLGNIDDALQAVDVGFMYKTKKDRQLALSYQKFFTGDGYFKLGYYHKLSFKK